MNGRTGLDYSALYPMLDRMKLSEAEYSAMFDDVQTLEFSALEEMNKQEDA